MLAGLAYGGSEKLLIGSSKDKQFFGLHFLIALGVCLILFILFNICIAVRNKKRYGGEDDENSKSRHYEEYRGVDCKQGIIYRTRAASWAKLRALKRYTLF